MNKTIAACKKSSLNPKDKEKLTKAGYLVIESDNPSAAVWFHKEPEPKPVLKSTICIECGCRIYLTEDQYDQRKAYKKTFYCINGHDQVFK